MVNSSFFTSESGARTQSYCLRFVVALLQNWIAHVDLHRAEGRLPVDRNAGRNPHGQIIPHTSRRSAYRTDAMDQAQRTEIGERRKVDPIVRRQNVRQPNLIGPNAKELAAKGGIGD